MFFLSTIGVCFIVATVGFLGGNRSSAKENIWEHLLITDDRWPRWVALQSGKVIFTRFGICMSDLGHGLLLVELLALVLSDTR